MYDNNTLHCVNKCMYILKFNTRFQSYFFLSLFKYILYCLFYRYSCKKMHIFLINMVFQFYWNKCVVFICLLPSFGGSPFGGGLASTQYKPWTKISARSTCSPFILWSGLTYRVILPFIYTPINVKRSGYSIPLKNEIRISNGKLWHV